MEKKLCLKNVDITISIWDLGGQKDYLSLMPLITSDAKCVLFVFDLCSISSLTSIKKWYKEVRKENKVSC